MQEKITVAEFAKMLGISYNAALYKITGRKAKSKKYQYEVEAVLIEGEDWEREIVGRRAVIMIKRESAERYIEENK